MTGWFDRLRRRVRRSPPSPLPLPEIGRPFPWHTLSGTQQLALREAYGLYLDTLPPTCDLGTKQTRWCAWLAEQGVECEVRERAGEGR